jgi:hypothetical protein
MLKAIGKRMRPEYPNPNQTPIMKTEEYSTNKKGKREHLNDSLTHSLVRDLNEYFETKVEIPRIRLGKRQKIETLINEEALMFLST